MAIIKIQSENEKRKGICYQFESTDLPIGEGGMGKVYKGLCVDQKNGSTRPVAIKFMYDDLPASAYERARREAEIQLRNDNLVEMLGFIETQEVSPLGEVRKHYHVVSELLTGVSLFDVLQGRTQDRDGKEVPFANKMLHDFHSDPEHFARIIVINVLSGLLALHDAGYIHRDIDPSNIMLTEDGHIKLIDFGIAKQMNNLTTGDKALTVAGKFMGKPEYAAPELVLGDIGHQNQTTDIYSVGILLYQCIVGHTPFEGARHEILEMQLKGKLPLSKIKSRALRSIVATACEKKQELRYQTAAQMRVALENMSGVKRAMSKQKKMTLVGIAASVIIAIACIAFVMKHKHDVARQEIEEARIEQQRQDSISSITAMIAEADRMGKLGLNKEEDNYELQLMKAYSSYKNAEKMAVKASYTSSMADTIVIKEKAILMALDSARVELTRQSVQLYEIGEVEMANTYAARAKDVENFINKNK